MATYLYDVGFESGIVSFMDKIASILDATPRILKHLKQDRKIQEWAAVKQGTSPVPPLEQMLPETSVRQARVKLHAQRETGKHEAIYDNAALVQVLKIRQSPVVPDYTVINTARYIAAEERRQHEESSEDYLT